MELEVSLEDNAEDEDEEEGAEVVVGSPVVEFGSVLSKNDRVTDLEAGAFTNELDVLVSAVLLLLLYEALNLGVCLKMVLPDSFFKTVGVDGSSGSPRAVMENFLLFGVDTEDCD
ncbi:hypothetical protein WICPIJ_009304 [Wickerhamomyces pijperi]|uniref:Uncharacterized protein n=1 Tax=Wickerhamomyces pijperi TaxID=599730 RepID=A0A9P8PQI9_WICPI|nr:hypothetical protein WICPIJ_009304 [Wickerhamomyces pijperi]